MSSTEEPRPAREPILNAPWPPLALAAVVLGCFLLQEAAGPAVWERFLFAPAFLGTDRSWTMLTTQFLHGGWTHVLMATAMIVAFGTPVSRLLGERPRGALAFFVLYMLCGVLGVWALGLLNPDSMRPALGSSAAFWGLFGATSRLLLQRGRLSPVFSRGPLGFTVVAVLFNVFLAIVAMSSGQEVHVPWEAHLAGFFAGMFLVEPFARLAGRFNPAAH